MTTILVIEDETQLREEVMEWLTFEGYEVLGAADGIEGVEYALHNLPHLIISDIMMPRLDGFGVLLELRSHPLTAAIPFIFITARAAHEDIRKGMSLGADDYLTKPFRRQELLEAVQARLGKKEIQDQQHQEAIEEWQLAFEQEREQRKLKAKLVAMFSHDFRNPLASILSSSSLLRNYSDRMDEARRLSHFNRIEASVRQLLQMLDDMLLIAQLETGNLEFAPEKVDVTAFLQKLIDDFQMIHTETHTLVLDSQVTTATLLDPRLLQQIATNLISNAIKYSPQGSTVFVNLAQDVQHLVLTVQDQGIGIPKADQQRLFTAFQRASNVGGVRGTGLGLAIVKQAVELQGGDIYLESAEGKGTTLKVALPLA